MKKYERGELDYYSLFAQYEACGIVIPGTNNMFAKKHKTLLDQEE
jgi:hypothetical protein